MTTQETKIANSLLEEITAHMNGDSLPGDLTDRIHNYESFLDATKARYEIALVCRDLGPVKTV